MNEVMDALVNRRSVRKYKAEAVPEELVKEIVEAGLYAPSGMGYQKPVILAVTDKETRDELSDLNRKAGGWNTLASATWSSVMQTNSRRQLQEKQDAHFSLNNFIIIRAGKLPCGNRE